MMGKNKDTPSGEQMDLIDVTPESLKEIKPIAKRYKAAMQARVEALKEEVEAKQGILSLIKDAHLSRLQDGSIKFKCDGMVITVTPRDELVKVKEEKKGDEEEE